MQKQLKKKLEKFLLFPLHIIIFILQYIFKFKITPWRVDRLGHIIANTEIFLRELKQNSDDKNFYVLFPFSYIKRGFICNNVAYDLYKRVITTKKNLYLIENSFLSYLLYKYTYYYPKYNKVMEITYNEYNLFTTTKSEVCFTQEEIKYGEEQLVKMGLDKTWIVSIFSRDDSYMENITGTNTTLYKSRNSEINDFIPAIKYILQQGGSVVRLGSVAKQRLDFNHPLVIDYPFSGYRTEFMDLFLVYKSKFIISTPSGATDPCMIFDIPRGSVNFVPVGHLSWCSVYDMGINKKIKKADGTYMGLYEYLYLEKEKNIYPYQHEKVKEILNITFEDNTPDEIYHLCKEINETLDNNLELTQEDIQNQETYQRIHALSYYSPDVKTKYSYHFLRKNNWFLEEK